MPIPLEQLDRAVLAVGEATTLRQVLDTLLSGEPYHAWYTVAVRRATGDWTACTLDEMNDPAEQRGSAVLDQALGELLAERPFTQTLDLAQTKNLRLAEEDARRAPGGRLLILDRGEPVGVVAARRRGGTAEAAVVRLFKAAAGPDMAQLLAWGMRTDFLRLRPHVTLAEADRALKEAIGGPERPLALAWLQKGQYLLLRESDLRPCLAEFGRYGLAQTFAAGRCEWKLPAVVEAGRVRPKQLPPSDVLVVHNGNPIGFFPGPARGVKPTPKAANGDGHERVVNAWFKDHAPSQPLNRSQKYDLGINVGAQRADSYVVGETYTGPVAQDVYVGLVGDLDAWQIDGPRVHKLHVPAEGDSEPVFFGVTPLKQGQYQLVAHFYHRNHLIQTVEITGIQVAIPDQAGAAAVSPQRPVAVTLTRAAPGADAVAARDANLYIEWLPDQDRFRFTFFSAPPNGAGEPVLHSARVPLTANEMSVMAGAARDAIETHLINFKEGENRPFLFLSKDKSQQPTDAGFQKAVMELAQLGYRWFIRLFYSQKEPDLMAEAEALGDLLLQASAAGRLRLQVVSSDFYLPWNLFYTPPSGQREPLTDATLNVDGIWGFRHVIEQVPARDLSHTGGGPVIDAADGLQVSASINLTVDGAKYKPASDQVKYFQSKAARPELKLALATRHTENEVLAAFQDPHNAEEIVYFYCHAITEGDASTRFQESRLVLTKEAQALKLDQLITGTFGLPPLSKAPLVFLNACGSAKMDAQFYDSFVQFMRDRGARTVIGTLNNTPTVVGAVFAMSFLEQFLQGGPEHSAAQLLFDLRRQFLDAYRNPVGLSYALFYNGDTYVKREA